MKYDADSSKIRADFERYGDIKTFFDIVNNRGMAFITYVCLVSETCGIHALIIHLIYQVRLEGRGGSQKWNA